MRVCKVKELIKEQFHANFPSLLEDVGSVAFCPAEKTRMSLKINLKKSLISEQLNRLHQRFFFFTTGKPAKALFLSLFQAVLLPFD